MLSDLVSIEDGDWDSVRQAHGAYARDLKRIFLSLGLGGDDMGGGVPKSANDQTVAQDGSYGYPVVTTDMLDELEAQFEAALDNIPSVTYPISIANGGTGSSTAEDAVHALGISACKNSSIYTSGSGSFSVPSGVTRLKFMAIGAAGGGEAASASPVFSYDTMSFFNGTGTGATGATIIGEFDVTPGESVSYSVGAAGSSASTFNGSDGTSGGSSSISFTSGASITAGGGERVFAFGRAGVPSYVNTSSDLTSRRLCCFGFAGSHATGRRISITLGSAAALSASSIDRTPQNIHFTPSGTVSVNSSIAGTQTAGAVVFYY